MWRGGRGCCGGDWAAWGAALVLASLWLAHGAARAGTAVQVRQAEAQVVPGGSFGAPPALPALDAAGWRPASLPLVLPRTLMPAGAGAPAIDTLWLRIEVPPDARAPGTEPLRLYLPRWQTIGQVTVYADGRQLFRSAGGPMWNGFNHPLWIVLNPAPGQAAPRAVLLRLDHLRSAGAGVSTAWFGDQAGLSARRQWRQFLQSELPYIASSAFLVIGLFSLLAWVARREAIYGLFFLFSGFWFVRSLHYHLGLEPLPIDEEWFGWLTVHSLSAVAIVCNIFALRLFQRRLPALEWPLVGAAALAAALGLPPLAVWPPAAQLAPLAYLVMFAAFVVSCAVCLAVAWRARSRQGLLVLGLNVATIPMAVHDWLLQNYRIDIEGIYIQPFSSISLSVTFLVLVVRRHVAALRRSERAQEELEEQLRIREADLVESHARLRVVEHQQILAQERQRLMQDMHDGLGSSLMGALKAVEHGAEQDLAEMLRHCIDDLKLAIDSLEPVQSDLLLLLATLRFRLGTRLEQAGLQLRWEVEDVAPLPWLDAASTLHILRVLQEALANVIKHSGARVVTLTTRQHGDAVEVAVEDDGQGFEPDAAEGRGRGLSNMRRRAANIGAQVAWERGAGGTRFVLSLPVRRAASPVDMAPAGLPGAPGRPRAPESPPVAA